MNLRNCLSRASLWFVAGLFILVTTAGTVWAQNGSTNGKTKVPAWREEPGQVGAGSMARTTDAADRAIARINASQLDHRTHNFGDMGTTAEGWHTSRHPRPDGSGSLDSWGWNQSLALAVGAGAWLSTPQVHESTGDFQSLSVADWEAMDGARGAQFSSPPRHGVATRCSPTATIPPPGQQPDGLHLRHSQTYGWEQIPGTSGNEPPTRRPTANSTTVVLPATPGPLF
jgi:hypothetical protein